MKYFIQYTSLLLCVLGFATIAWGQPTNVQHALTEQYAKEAAQRYEIQQAKLAAAAARFKIPMTIEKEDRLLYLTAISPDGHPTYEANFNVVSQRTASADQVKAGGNLGLNLTGAGIRVGVWEAFEKDGGSAIRNTHDEFDGRVTLMDGNSFSDHATHVAGTIIAAGVDPAAQGFAHAAEVDGYDASSDQSEMATAAANDNIVISNHSYGAIIGYNDGSYTGPAGTTEDPRFGAYMSRTRDWDQTAYNTPFLLVVKAAGNDRGDSPSADDTSGAEIDGGANGFDCLPPGSTAKNILSVAAANAMPGNYTGPGDPSLTGFSSTGPTDDGRIKPDIAAQGASLYSPGEEDDDDYANKSGTSMAAPSVAGGAALLHEHWGDVIGGTPSAVTMKGLLLHTADEVGNADGPDYRFGWGMMNVEDAATLITVDGYEGCSHYIEDNIDTGDKRDYSISSTGDGPLKITLVWHDPAATNTNDGTVLNPNTSYLVNDLDMRLTHTATNTVFFPFRLDPNNPAAAATRGNNNRDNVEQILVLDPLPGAYTISLAGQGAITNGPQDYTIWILGNDAADDHLNINNVAINDTRTYAARQTITFGPNVTVLPSADVESYAGDFIRIQPETHIQAGSHFLARIAPGGGCGGFSSDMKRDNYPGVLPLAAPLSDAPETVIEQETPAVVAAPLTLSTGLTLAPNPAELSTSITYEIGQDAVVELTLLNAYGQAVRSIVPPSAMATGKYQHDLDVSNLPKGVYLLRMVVDEEQELRKLVVQ